MVPTGRKTLRWAAQGAVILGTVALDRATKLFFMEHLPADGRVFHIFGPLSLIRHTNLGIVANIPIPVPVTIAATFIILFFVVRALLRALHDEWIARAIFLSVLLGGAVGNLWDRLSYHFVFDWLLLFNKSIVNIADIAIVIGILGYIFSEKTAPVLLTETKKST